MSNNRSDAVHIASFVIYLKPEHIAAASAELLAMSGVEIAQTDTTGKLIVVLETDSDAGVARFLDLAHQLPGVAAVNFVYHQSENETELAKEIA
ncbi:chaperone NapD [Permianibacter aggregans]|uniref:Chaperone NapD n=1 Tax=Permianibacter aggregans TaxID=1510150 RepID=A0A4R6UCB9_9GAMM|nr:chaperone NapD [Permianibacter aggregans]QGX40942.1 glutamate synthase [Permianibacter aggregans]TDQ43622.1 periplasmic nitrate reductase chaperone NapD [Permianibacter aggregans]